MISNRYQNSVCRNSYLHDYKYFKATPLGILERCSRCGKTLHVPNDMPNHVFLSHHIRSALRSNDPLFKHEYPDID